MFIKKCEKLALAYYLSNDLHAIFFKVYAGIKASQFHA